MTERGWQKYICSVCGKTFFSKLSSETSAPNCGWRKCGEKYHSHTLGKRKKVLLPAQINESIAKYFGSINFDLMESQNIANSKGRTDLIVAGVQIFDDIIHRDQKIQVKKIFISQPCVRMQFQPYVESQDGTSTSFVNVCTEMLGVSLDEHLQSVDHWYTVLSKLGLHMNDFTVIARISDNNWGTGGFSSIELFFSYKGLELGDASYQLIPQANQTLVSVSDIGFGLERIAWAVNKTDSYFDILTPWTVIGPREMLDLCRTISLLIICGVKASNKGPGLQFRRLAKILSEKYYDTDIYGAIAYYFNYWVQFIEPLVNQETAIQIARLEIERFINLKICEMLNLASPRDETTENYCNRLVCAHNASIHELLEAIRACKK